MHILVIEDDMDVREFICAGLTEAGHTVEMASDGKSGLIQASTENFAVIILDRMLPLVDGMNVISTLRACGNDTPVLFLSARGKVEDKVSGLRAGADDYLAKPFAFEELLARVEILAQRKNASANETALVCGDLSLDLLTRKVTREDNEIELQSREFRLLEYLLRNKGKVVTRTMLLENVWDYNFDPQTNLIDVHISRLRQKIDKGYSVTMIETVRGAGYRISES